VDQATRYETITVALARTLRNTDVGFTGLTTGARAAMFGTMIPLAAMELARLQHAPDLTSLLAGWCHNPALSDLTDLPDSEFDPVLLRLACDDLDMTWPAQISIKRGDVTVGFCSAAQVDREGNVNTVRISGAGRRHVELVGPILVPEHLALFQREVIMMPRHDRRTFVETVDYRTGVGFPGGRAGRAALGLPGQGPELIVTPLCIFDFDEHGAARLRSVHPGVSVQEVIDATGFAIAGAERPAITAPPTERELELLRGHIDTGGFLRQEAASEGSTDVR